MSQILGLKACAPINKNLQVTSQNAAGYQCIIISFWPTEKYINDFGPWLLAFASFRGSLDPGLSNLSPHSVSLGQRALLRVFYRPSIYSYVFP